MTAPCSAARPLTTLPHLLAVLAITLTGCSFGADLDNGFIAECTTDADCPAGFTCSRHGYCFEDTADTRPDATHPDLDDLSELTDDTPELTALDTADSTADANQAALDTEPADQTDLSDAPSCGTRDCTTNQLCCTLEDGAPGCVDPRTDPLHCGTCGSACSSPDVCESGACVCPRSDGEPGEQCAPHELCCEDGCRDPLTSESHCGGCNLACNPGEQCIDGTCQCGDTGAACDAGVVCCSGACCGTDEELCCDGECKPPSDPTCECGSHGVCPADQLCCRDDSAADCAALLADVQHCGACGNACAAGQRCEDGQCVCSPGFTDCDLDPTNGCEIETARDGDNCGTCGNACAAGLTCSASACVCPDGAPLDVPTNCGFCGNACSAGQACCGGTCANLTNDERHCSACGVSCGADQQCCAGACLDVLTDEANCGLCGNACASGQQCCDGACRDLASDDNNCGACGNRCEAGRSCCNGSCVDVANDLAHCGFCGNACGAGRSCCNGACRALATDVTNCGSCGNVCPARPQATAICDGGACAIQCSTTFADCDHDPTNGCEVNLATNPQHCGGCGNLCPSQNGTASCVSGLCALSCLGSFRDCDNDATSGCEVDISSSTAHCGACGNACSTNHNTPSCSGGACTLSCQPGWGNCNGSVADGCETSLTTSSNCAACGVTCVGQNTCCPSGCARLDRDEDNCGSCGNVCASINGVATCNSSTCSIVCNAGFRNCDNDFSNGCEYQGSSCP